VCTFAHGDNEIRSKSDNTLQLGNTNQSYPNPNFEPLNYMYLYDPNNPVMTNQINPMVFQDPMLYYNYQNYQVGKIYHIKYR